MTRLTFNDPTTRFYETGVMNAVLYLRDKETGRYPKGVPWPGLTAVTESPGGAEPTDLFALNEKYATLMSKETFGGTIEAYTYPEEFNACDGNSEVHWDGDSGEGLVPGVLIGQQPRAVFGLSYQTNIGSGEGGPDVGYLTHLIYGCIASPSDKARNSIGESPEALTFSWEFKTTPVVSRLSNPPQGAGEFNTTAPTSHIIIDSRKYPADQMPCLLDYLWGVEGDQGPDVGLPLPDELQGIFGVGCNEQP